MSWKPEPFTTAPTAPTAAEYRYFIGKRLDGKGWDLIVKLSEESWDVYGPFRRRRDAQIHLLSGSYATDKRCFSERAA